jgi:hypothetical protein
MTDRWGLRRLPRPLFIAVILCGASVAAGAQDPVRPWLAWRTVESNGFRFHYLPEIETWTRDLAERVRAIDSAITRHVGWQVVKPVDVVVDDPYIISNGYALPFMDRPVTVWYATPADPRNDIGNYRTWGEMLSVHELVHLAHLTRPSRNPFQRSLWASLPVNISPLVLKTPRWVFEGYATAVEGRITGTGRPHNAWRPALLRQWAIEGQLPSYGQLNAAGDYRGGEFAYLGGSAFLEWLMRRQGDSSLTHLWRRLTARQVRSFDAAFRGVYGDSPATLYGLHTAELTRDAMAAKEALEEAGLIQGELIQRLTWETGDPAISPDGERVAITLRERDRPGRLVVWKTSAEAEDTAAIRRRIDALKRDPQDVPDRRFYPRPKTPEATLLAAQGRSYQMPRWYSDNRRVLVTRWTARGDNTLSPSLYEWDTKTGNVRQITNAVGVLHGDPHPNSDEALAMQCHWGHCDVVHVDLERGVMRTLLEGAPDRTYYRPRYSPDGTRFVASVLDGARWKLLVSSNNAREIRFVDPEDGANRYDAQWLTSDTLVVVSERGGIPNLEKISVSSARPVALTRVTGAAVGPDVNRADGSVWFLALHSRGLDVRRIPADSPIADSVVDVRGARFGYAGMRGADAVELPATQAPPSHPYGAGPRHQRWLPGAFTNPDGSGAMLSVYSGDIVGRLTGVVTGAIGERGSWQGGSLRTTWRYARPHVEVGAHAFIHEPSLSSHRPAGDTIAAPVDGSLSQIIAAVKHERSGESWRLTTRLGGSGGLLSPRDAPSHQRALGFLEAAARVHRTRGARGISAELRAHGSYGQSRGRYQRVVGTIDLRTLGRDMFPLQASITHGRVVGSPHPFEQFSIGGGTSPVMDSSLLTQRHALPMYPTAVSVGPSLLAWRASIPGNWTLFYEAASTAATLYDHARWHRAVGFDAKLAFPVTPVAFLPRIEIRGGAAYTLDEPLRRKVRAFLAMTFEP